MVLSATRVVVVRTVPFRFGGAATPSANAGAVCFRGHVERRT
jgi:hypothetical protein